MNQNKLITSVSNQKRGRKLQDFSIYFEETPPTIFKNKWLKSLSQKTRKFKLNFD